MSDVVSNAANDVKKIKVFGTIKDGIAIGFKNIGPILVNLLLWILTCWIPYINVGTTIGMFVGIIAKAARNESISMTEIFDRKYRKFMGEYFLVTGLMGLGITIGFAFMIIPGIIISIAWVFAPLIVIDKGKSPMEGISISYQTTNGNKGKIYGALFFVTLIYLILSCIIGIIMAITVLGVLLLIVAALFYIFVYIGIYASLYKQLADNVS
ncbi:MAG: hypothetical protein FWC03_09895 [Treponema sp.]|nr:hypothetical protein [Treponema sp.]